MLQIVICEDDKKQLTFISKTVKSILSGTICNIVQYTDCNDFLDIVDGGNALFDIAIIDIELGSTLNGIDIAKLINKKIPIPKSYLFLRI